MKFTVRGNDIIKAVQSCSRVIVSSSPSPVLTNILIDAQSRKDEGLLRLFSTDLEMYYEVFIPAGVEIPGEVMVSSKIFSDVLASFSGDGDVSFSCNRENFNIDIRRDKMECTLFGLPPDDFPGLPIFDKNEPYSFKFSLSKLQSIIRDTIYAVSTEQIKPAYCGLCFKVIEKGVRAITTDGKRLALSECSLPDSGLTEKNDVIIMAKVLNEIAKSPCDPSNDEIELSVYSNQVAFKTKNYSYYARIIDGKFPDYNQVIPKDCKIKITAKVGEVAACLRKTLPIAHENSNTIKLNVTGESIVYTAKSTKIGSIKLESAIIPIMAGELEINFNAKFFQDILSTIKSEECVLEFTNPQSPVKIYPKDEMQNETHVHILMPVRPGFGG